MESGLESEWPEMPSNNKSVDNLLKGMFGSKLKKQKGESEEHSDHPSPS